MMATTLDDAATELFGDSEMGRVMRAVDWSVTSLGPVDQWPPSLRMMVRLILANRMPILLWWGPDYIQLYNDAYRPVLGAKHPVSMGQPTRECWHEIWHVLEPLIDTPYTGGPATWMEDILLEINRYGFVEETHFTIAYSPVPDESAPSGIGGVIATVHEITQKVVGERRVGVLRDLGRRSLVEAQTAEATCATAAGIPGEARHRRPVRRDLLDRPGRQARDTRRYVRRHRGGRAHEPSRDRRAGVGDDSRSSTFLPGSIASRRGQLGRSAAHGGDRARFPRASRVSPREYSWPASVVDSSARRTAPGLFRDARRTARDGHRECPRL